MTTLHDTKPFVYTFKQVNAFWMKMPDFPLNSKPIHINLAQNTVEYVSFLFFLNF